MVLWHQRQASIVHNESPMTEYLISLVLTLNEGRTHESHNNQNTQVSKLPPESLEINICINCYVLRHFLVLR